MYQKVFSTNHRTLVTSTVLSTSDSLSKSLALYIHSPGIAVGTQVVLSASPLGVEGHNMLNAPVASLVSMAGGIGVDSVEKKSYHLL